MGASTSPSIYRLKIEIVRSQVLLWAVPAWDDLAWV